MTKPLRLYYAPDNASLIIRLALEEIGAPYDTVLLDRRQEAQRAPAYLALNPAGKIPTLETPEGVISETGAILLWLNDRYDGIRVLQGRAGFLKWLFFVANTLHPDLIMLFYTERYGPAGAVADMRARCDARIRAHLDLLENCAAATPPWFGGDRVSVLDYYVATCLRWLALYPVGHARPLDLSCWPNLQRMLTALETRPATRAAQRAEGLGATPFTNPSYATPPEGSAV